MLTPMPTPEPIVHGGPVPYDRPRDAHVGGYAHPGRRETCRLCRDGHWHNCVRIGCAERVEAVAA